LDGHSLFYLFVLGCIFGSIYTISHTYNFKLFVSLG